MYEIPQYLPFVQYPPCMPVQPLATAGDRLEAVKNFDGSITVRFFDHEIGRFLTVVVTKNGRYRYYF